MTFATFGPSPSRSEDFIKRIDATDRERECIREAGECLLEARKLYPGEKDFEAFLKRADGVQISHATELMEIAARKKIFEEVKPGLKRASSGRDVTINVRAERVVMIEPRPAPLTICPSSEWRVMSDVKRRRTSLMK
jgi:hypothetical protein